jgi:hypothetical protein
MKTLFLSLHKQAFEVMVTGEKQEEIRSDSQWIQSRFYKNGKIKDYDLVKCVNGYGNHRPYFVAKFLEFYRQSKAERYEYSTGFAVVALPGDYIIILGKIIETGNLK